MKARFSVFFSDIPPFMTLPLAVAIDNELMLFL
jgi:hypothetical protein